MTCAHAPMSARSFESSPPPVFPPPQLALVLHGHLPFVRHPEHERFLEESWLFEAIADCYLPLAEVIEGWADDGVPARLTFSASPTLLAMWNDPLLRARTTRYLLGRIELARLEIRRTHWTPAGNLLARWYLERFERLHARWQGMGCDLAGFLGRMEARGVIELITTAATHPVLPLLEDDGASLSVQVELACLSHEAAFGRRPSGFWLPECAWSSCVGPVLRRSGIAWSILDTHGLVHARPSPKAASYAPVQTADGLVVFGRDHTSARQVWSREGGYPGDPRYRDFYRDIGWDLDLDYVEPFLPSPGIRGFTGFKGHRIGHADGGHGIYDPVEAGKAVRDHAGHFVDQFIRRAGVLVGETSGSVIFVAPYDAELFGHWWFEGPQFLDAVVRRAADHPEAIRMGSPGDRLQGVRRLEIVEPPTCSWGEGGYLAAWLATGNQWILPELHDAGALLRRWASRGPPQTSLGERLFAQAARELLLAQSSDWPFMIHNRTSPHYAEARARGHLDVIRSLAEASSWVQASERLVAEHEARTPLFAQLDWRLWTSTAQRKQSAPQGRG